MMEPATDEYQESLPFVPKPRIGEHVLGYVRRLSDANGMLSMREFWVGMGVPTMTPNSEDEIWQRFRSVTGLDGQMLDRLRRPFVGTSKLAVALVGRPIRKSFLVDRRLRHCPECTSASGVLQPAWSIFHVTACSAHGNRLQDTCRGCGEELRLFSKTEIWGCSACSADIREPPSEKASEAEVAFTKLVEARLGLAEDVVELCPALAGATLNQLVTMVDRFGKLATTAPEDDPSVRGRRVKTRLAGVDQTGGVVRMAAATQLGTEILLNWPEAYHALLSGLLDRNVDPDQKNALRRRYATEMGLLAITPMEDLDGEAIEPPHSELKRFCLERLDYVWGQRRPDAPVNIRLYGAVHEERMGRKLSAPKTKIDSSAHTAHARSDYATCEEAMEKLEGCRRASITSWVKAGLLVVRPGKAHVVDRRSLDELANRLRSRVFVVEPDPVLLRIGAIQPKRLEKARSQLLHDIFAGRVKVYGPNSDLGIMQLHIHPEELDAMQARYTLNEMIARQKFYPLAWINRHMRRIWGDAGVMRPREARQAVKEGLVRVRYGDPIAGQKNHTASFYKVEDVVLTIQRTNSVMFG